MFRVAKKINNVYYAQKINLRKAINSNTKFFEVNKYDKKINPVLRGINKSKNVKIAVVLHLYYTESWDEFRSRLEMLYSNNEGNFDLFVSLPKQNTDFIDIIKRSYPNAYFLVVPNRGRDVLPFIKILPTLQESGYELFLKLHSKKSKHRDDGHEWLSDMLEKLLPKNQKIIHQIIDVLEKPDSSIIGPQGHYVPLSINFRQNWVHIGNILELIYSKKLKNSIKKDYKKYGFFAGTMFWGRVDYLKKINGVFNVDNFEREKGQIDCTFAHALERVFCLIPEIEEKNIFAINSKGVKQMKYKSKNIPNWSRVRKS